MLQVRATLSILDDALNSVENPHRITIHGGRLGEMLWLLSDKLEEVFNDRGVVELTEQAGHTPSPPNSTEADP